MWVVIKYKSKELNVLKQNITKMYGDQIIFCNPKIKLQKYTNNKLETLEKFILGNYLIFNHRECKDDNVLLKLKYMKGLKYVLKNFKYNQKEIQNFVEYCRKFEDENGYITQDFFADTTFAKGKFINGPFTNMIFSIISEQKSKLKILVNNIVTTISKKSGYLYRPV